jgi:hypothetical protein
MVMPNETCLETYQQPAFKPCCAARTRIAPARVNVNDTRITHTCLLRPARVRKKAPRPTIVLAAALLASSRASKRSAGERSIQTTSTAPPQGVSLRGRSSKRGGVPPREGAAAAARPSRSAAEVTSQPHA